VRSYKLQTAFLVVAAVGLLVALVRAVVRAVVG
jgi:hypothetical protein